MRAGVPDEAASQVLAITDRKGGDSCSVDVGEGDIVLVAGKGHEDYQR